jgi:hypothetical protein
VSYEAGCGESEELMESGWKQGASYHEQIDAFAFVRMKTFLRKALPAQTPNIGIAP